MPGQKSGTSWNGRTSIGRVVAAVAFSAHVRAASRSGDVDDPEPADVFLPLEVGTVGDHDVAFAAAHHRAGRRVVQPAGEHPGTGGLELGLERVQVRRRLAP